MDWLKRNLLPAALVGLICSTLVAFAASQGHFLGVVFLADPTTPTQQAGVNAAGQLSVTSSSTTGGDSVYSAPGGTGNALITNTAVTAVSGAHSLVQGTAFHNTGNADCYIQFFDLAAGSVTLGTTIPKFFVWVPTAGAWSLDTSGEGVAFGTAITVAATTTTTGNSACNASQQAVVIYK